MRRAPGADRSPAVTIRLQSVVGNRALGRLLSGGSVTARITRVRGGVARATVSITLRWFIPIAKMSARQLAATQTEPRVFYPNLQGGSAGGGQLLALTAFLTRSK